MPFPADGRVLLATRSAHKLREIQQILVASTRLVILSLEDVGIPPAAEEEDIEVHDTFIDNAAAKAAYFCRASGLPVIADDSGISVHALGGEPGVRSRRFTRVAGLNGAKLDLANNDELLRRLRDVPAPRRTAHYTCAAVMHCPEGQRAAAIGTCAGLILDSPRGSGGFGYDPLFLDVRTGLSFGETDAAEKNRISHRARAFRALAALIAR